MRSAETSKSRTLRRVALVAGLAVLALPVVPVPVSADTGTPPTFLRTLGGPLHAEMYPSGGEVAPDGDLVVADTGNNQVARYEWNGSAWVQLWRIGTHGSGVGQFLNPRDTGVDSQGNAYVVDTRNSRVQKVSPTGVVVTTFNGPTGDKMSWPMGITVTNDTVYVADAGKNKIRVFNTSGTQLLAFGSSPGCQLNDPRDADADAAGNIYVANYAANNILKFSSTGTCIGSWGSTGSGPGQFRTPYGVRVAFDPVLGRQLLYVADGNNDRAQVFELDGTFVGMFGSSGDPTNPGSFAEVRRVAVESDGDVWIIDLWGWKWERFQRTPTEWIYAETVGTPLPPATDTAVFHEARGIAFEANGTTVIVDTVHHRIVRMNPDTGAILSMCGKRGSATGEFNWPRGVAVDPATGNYWVANTKQYNIHIIKPDCTPVTKFGSFGSALGQFNWPYSIAIRPSDRIAFIADNRNHRIVSYDVATRLPVAAFGSKGSGTGQFNEPSGIAVNPANGRVLVADALNNRVVELSDVGGTSFAVQRVFTGFNRPNGVAADGDGRIFVADSGNNQVVVLNPDGTVLATFSSPSAFDAPENVAVDALGRIYVADTYNDRVQLYEGYGGGPPPPDTTPPDAQVTTPTQDQVFTSTPVAMSGTATDNVGVTEVRVAIKDRTTGLWYRADGTWGSLQQHQATLSSPGGTSTGWTYSWTPAPGGSGSYALQVAAVDGAGNVDPTKPWVRFTVSSDTTPPDGQVTTPTQDQVFTSSPVAMSGTATDNVGVTEVRVAIKDRTTGLWYRADGTWGSFQQHQAALSSPGGTSTGWTYSWTQAPGGSGSYALQVAAMDGAGNVDPTKPWVRFTVSP